MPLGSVYVEANFKETQIAELTPGTAVHMHFDAFPDRDVIGARRRASPRPRAPQFSLLPPENATGNFTKVVQRVPVRVAVPRDVAAEGWLRPGLSVAGDRRTSAPPSRERRRIPLRQSAMDTAEPQVTPRRLIAFFALVFGMFMAILDIQIVSSSLGEIQAGLSAAPEEISWVQTSYLIAEVIMIPLSGFLARALSTRILFSVSAAGFTAASLLCATATSIDQMIVYRAIQGFIGGAMIPLAFAAAYTIFPKRAQAAVMAVVGLTVTLAPTIGPTVGGYLTELLSWHWLFLVNIVPGIAVTAVAWTMVDFDKPELALLRRFDFVALAGMAVFLGSLEYVLEEGQKNDWFEDRGILLFSVASALGALVFFRQRADRQGSHRRPARLPRPQLRRRLAPELRARRRPLWPHLPLPALPRPGARLHRARDRRHGLRHRPLHVPGRAGGRVPRRARSTRGCSSPSASPASRCRASISPASPATGPSASSSCRRRCAGRR